MAYVPKGTYNDSGLSASDRQKIESYQSAYQQASASGDKAAMDAAHRSAEAVRASSGYSGGYDGSGYIQLQQPQPTISRSSGINTQAMRDAMIAAKNALLEQQYNKDFGNLERAYGDNLLNMSEYQGQVGQQFDGVVKDIQQQTYEELQRSKELGAQRGITNSALGRSQDQTMLRAGADSVNNASIERNRLLNDITSRINNLTQTYGRDTSVLEQNLGLAKSQAMSEADLAKMNADLDLYKFDTSWDREQLATTNAQDFTREMTALQNSFTVDLSKLNHQQSLELARLSTASQERLASASRGASQSQFNTMLQQEISNSQIERTSGLFSDRMGAGTDAFNNLPKAEQNAVYSILDQIGSGSISSYSDAVKAFMNYKSNNTYRTNKME